MNKATCQLFRASFVIVIIVGFARLASAQFSSTVLSDNPISYWRLNENSGPTAFDATSSANDGNNLGGVSLGVPGIVDNGYGFNGTGARVDMGNPANLNFGTTGEFSVEAVFNWDGGGSSINNIIRKSDFPVSPPGSGYWLRINRDTQTLNFFTGETTGVGTSGSVSTTLSPNEWHHAVGTRDSSGVMRLFLDGDLAAIASSPGTDTTSPAPFLLGAWDDRFGIIEFFSGTIDEAAVYDSALSPDQVLAHARAAGVAEQVPEPTSVLIWSSLGLVLAGFGYYRFRQK